MSYCPGAVLVVSTMIALAWQAPQHLSEDTGRRLDAAVRSAAAGYTFSGVVSGKLGQRYRWTKAGDEIVVTATVFATPEEARAQLRKSVALVSVGVKPLPGVGDLAFLAGGASSNTHVYASVGPVLFHSSVPRSEPLARRLAADIARELAPSMK